MQRTFRLFSILFAGLVITSLFLLYRQLGITRHAPPLSVPGPDGYTSPSSQLRKAYRVPTVLSPDTGGEDILAPAASESSGFWPLELPGTEAAHVTAVPQGDLSAEPVPPNSPLPLDQSLVPLPDPAWQGDMPDSHLQWPGGDRTALEPDQGRAR